MTLALETHLRLIDAFLEGRIIDCLLADLHDSHVDASGGVI